MEQQIGRYKIIGELGRGAMGVVFRALDPSIGREVAIKTIRLGEFADPDQRAKQRERLFREARSSGILSHPSIVTIYDMAEQDETAYIAMEFVNGSTLEQLLAAKHALPPDRIFSILRQTAAGLDYAHHKGIVHRDIKPANIMVNESGVAKIADFGIAKISAADQLTQTGLIVGTPNYMAPEQVQGKPVSGLADQYSLTVVAYEMLTGDKPFVAEQLTTLVYQIVCEPPPPAQRLNPTLGGKVEAVLQKGLSKQPVERYTTCASLIDALEAACAATPGWTSLARGASLDLPTMAEMPPARPPEPEPVQPEPVRNLPPPHVREPVAAKRSRALPVLAFATLAAALAGAVYYASQPIVPVTPPSPPPVVVAETKKEEPPKPIETPAQPTPAASEPTAPAETPAPVEQRPMATPPRIQTSVEVPVRSQPSGATATLDGLPGTACITPCLLKASIGDHIITLNLPGFKTVTRPIQVTNAPLDLPVITMAQAIGVLMVQSQPDGATITIDDRRWPNSTPTQVSLPPGKYRIAVEKGDVKAVQTIEVRDGDLRHLSFTLAQQ